MTVRTHSCVAVELPPDYALFHISPPFGPRDQWFVVLIRPEPETNYPVRVKGSGPNLAVACTRAMEQWPVALLKHQGHVKTGSAPRVHKTPTADELDFLDDI